MPKPWQCFARPGRMSGCSRSRFVSPRSEARMRRSTTNSAATLKRRSAATANRSPHPRGTDPRFECRDRGRAPRRQRASPSPARQRYGRRSTGRPLHDRLRMLRCVTFRPSIAASRHHALKWMMPTSFSTPAPMDTPTSYGVNCSQRDGRWLESGSSNGPGWSQAGPDDRLGTLVVWGEAPPDAEMVRLAFEGTAIEERVNNGVYLAVWWRTRCPEESWPRVEGFRIRGMWIQAA